MFFETDNKTAVKCYDVIDKPLSQWQTASVQVIMSARAVAPPPHTTGLVLCLQIIRSSDDLGGKLYLK